MAQVRRGKMKEKKKKKQRRKPKTRKNGQKEKRDTSRHVRGIKEQRGRRTVGGKASLTGRVSDGGWKSWDSEKCRTECMIWGCKRKEWCVWLGGVRLRSSKNRSSVRDSWQEYKSSRELGWCRGTGCTKPHPRTRNGVMTNTAGGRPLLYFCIKVGS